VLLAKEQTILQTMIDKVTEVGRRYGMEINVEKTKTMRISKQPTPLHIKTYENRLGMWKSSINLGSMITNDARCALEIKFRIAMAKAELNRKKTLFSSKLNLEIRKN
jgi:hypothetical protein